MEHLMAMRLMLVISDLHSDAYKLPNLQPSSLTSSQRQLKYKLHTSRRLIVDGTT
jgi:hypothetical protein